MKTFCGFVGWIVGCFVGICFANTAPIIGFICIIGGIPLGRWIGGQIEESKEQELAARERAYWEKRKQETEASQRREKHKKALSLLSWYPEATKEYFRIHWGITRSIITQFDITDDKVDKLLSHSETEYQNLEEKLNVAYRAKKEAQRQAERRAAEKKREEERRAAERKRREEELARQKKEEEIRNLVNTLPACVESWRSHSNSSLKHLFFYDYYSYANYKNNASPGMWEVWRTVWHFKNDPNKNVSNIEHDMALRKVTNLVETALRNTFGSKTEYLTLVCLTASTQRKTEMRYKDFADKICKDLNMINAYPYIQVIEGGSAKHDGGDGSRRVSYDRYFFSGKYVVLFDDVRTTGHSLEQERQTMEELGAKVICAITIAQTTY
jgi:predicted amidophosphoribosyltransferase